MSPTLLICNYTILIAITEGEEYWRASEVESIAQTALKIALVTPVQKA